MRVLVFQHIDVEHPGIFREFMAADGHDWDVVALDEGDAIPSSLDGYDVLMVMGGPMDVWDEDTLPWLKAEKAAIREWVVDRRGPFLGICLGHQLLAEAIGCSVTLIDDPEVGVYDVRLTDAGRADDLFQGVADRFPCLQWHGAGVTQVPPHATVTAVGADGAVQAIRYGRWAYGFQFHVEVTPDTVTDWAAIPAYHRSLTDVMGPDGLERFDRDVQARLDAFAALARRVFDNFVAVVGDTAAEPAGEIRAAGGPAYAT